MERPHDPDLAKHFCERMVNFVENSRSNCQSPTISHLLTVRESSEGFAKYSDNFIRNHCYNLPTNLQQL